MKPNVQETFAQERKRLLSICYRMLGSISDSEDVLQDAFLRWQAQDHETIDSPGAYLSKLVTRLCIDALTSARRGSETYVGPWLPEPVLGDEAQAILASGERAAERFGDISVALMLALERLSPLERAAFILHDVFELDYAEISAVLRRSEAACRQLATRARKNVRLARPRFEPSTTESQSILQAFGVAVSSGDLDALKCLLAENAAFYSDGGGRVRSATKPIFGRDNVAKFVVGIAAKFPRTPGTDVAFTAVNGLPGIVLSVERRVIQTFAFDIVANEVVAVYAVRNPEKLAHLTRSNTCNFPVPSTPTTNSPVPCSG